MRRNQWIAWPVVLAVLVFALGRLTYVAIEGYQRDGAIGMVLPVALGLLTVGILWAGYRSTTRCSICGARDGTVRSCAANTAAGRTYKFVCATCVERSHHPN